MKSQKLKYIMLFKMDVISSVGCIHFLNDDPALVEESMKNNVNLIDLRKPGFPPKFPKGSWKKKHFQFF